MMYSLRRRDALALGLSVLASSGAFASVQL